MTETQPAASRPTALDEAVSVCTAAADQGITVRLAGGLAIQYLTPNFPPRGGDRQDLDMAIESSDRRPLTQFLTERGYIGDKTFNALYGHKQLYFQSPQTERSLDVLVDRLHMCHTVEFKGRLGRMPVTLDLTDLLLTKLQIVELNAKDARDIVQLLSCLPIRPASSAPGIDAERFRQVLGADWGWWRTVTGNLDKLPGLLGANPQLAQPGMPFDPVAQAARLRQLADEAPKTMKWKVRASIGEKSRWYELPEEVAH